MHESRTLSGKHTKEKAERAADRRQDMKNDAGGGGGTSSIWTRGAESEQI
jgi:hypothetical protein